MRASGRLGLRSFFTRQIHSTEYCKAKKSTLTTMHTNNRDDRGTDSHQSSLNRRMVPSTLDDLNNNNLVNVSQVVEDFDRVNNNNTSSNSQNAIANTPPLKVVNSPERGPVELLENSERSTIVYTDASVKNGIGGIGVFFGDHDNHNISERLNGYHDSSGLCEIIAALRALESCANRNIKGPIVLRTDYLYIVEAMQMPALLAITPYKEMSKLHDIAVNYPGGVQFEHVYAHMGNYGNERADQLATSATNRNRRPSPSRPRSKPPSRRMQRRTRKAFVSRRTKSVPPRMPCNTAMKQCKKLNQAPQFSNNPAPLSINHPRSLSVESTEPCRSTKSAVQSQSSSITPVSVPAVVTARKERQATVLRSDWTQRSTDSKRSTTSVSTQNNSAVTTKVKPGIENPPDSSNNLQV